MNANKIITSLASDLQEHELKKYDSLDDREMTANSLIIRINEAKKIKISDMDKSFRSAWEVVIKSAKKSYLL